MPAITTETTVFGMNGSGNWADPELRPQNYRELAFKLFPDSPSPFTKILSKLPSSNTDDPYYHIFEWRLPKMAFVLNGDHATAVTTLVLENTGTEPVDPAQGLKEGDLLKDETSGEIVLITTAPSSPWINIIVQRHWGGTNAGSAITDTSVLRWVGSAYEEGVGAPGAVSKRASVVLNYTQIFKDTADITGTAEQMKTRPMKPWPQLKGEALERHMIKMEYAMLHGIQHAEAGVDHEIRTTGGFREQIGAAQGVVDMSSVTIDMLENEMQTSFTYGSDVKIGLVGYTALNYINKLVRTNTQFQFNHPLPKEQTYGLNVTELRSPFGSLMLIPHPLMAESALYTTELYIIDPKYVEYVSMRGRDTKWKDNAQANDVDGRKGFYQTEAGMRLALPEVHSVWTGLSSLG